MRLAGLSLGAAAGADPAGAMVRRCGAARRHDQLFDPAVRARHFEGQREVGVWRQADGTTAGLQCDAAILKCDASGALDAQPDVRQVGAGSRGQPQGQLPPLAGYFERNPRIEVDVTRPAPDRHIAAPARRVVPDEVRNVGVQASDRLQPGAWVCADETKLDVRAVRAFCRASVQPRSPRSASSASHTTCCPPQTWKRAAGSNWPVFSMNIRPLEGRAG